MRVIPATSTDRYGDIFVDRKKSMAVFEEWMRMTKSAPGPGGAAAAVVVAETV